MKNYQLVAELQQLNPKADVGVVVHNQVEQFTITTGGNMDGEGTPREQATGVHFYVDRLCQDEQQ